MDTNIDRRFVDVKEIALYLGLSEHTIRAWRRQGRIPFMKFGRSIRFDLRMIDRWAQRQECALPEARGGI